MTKVDRIARNTIDALRIADQLANKGAKLVFHDLGDLDINSDVGRVIYITISAFAEKERKRILQRCNGGRYLDFLIKPYIYAYRSSLIRG